MVSFPPMKMWRIYSPIHVDAPEPGPSGTPHDDPPAITSPEPPIPVSPMVVEPINNEPPAISSDMSEGLKAYLMTIVRWSDYGVAADLTAYI